MNANDALDLARSGSSRGGGIGVSGVIGPVELRIPPDTQLSRVVRLAAGAVASMAGFDVDLIEDAKLTVSEVVLALIELGSGGLVDVTVEADGAVLAIRASSATDRVDLEDPDLTLCRTVLAGVTATHDVTLVGGRVVISATLRDLAG